MAHLNLVASLVNELDDVETKLRLYDFGYFRGVGEVEGYSSEGRVKRGASLVVQFSAQTG